MPHATIDIMKTAETIIRKQVCDLGELIKQYVDGFEVEFLSFGLNYKVKFV